MSAPLIDPRTREDIIEEIRALAHERVPEWRFDPDNPDAGAMLALIWADMLCGTIERLNRVTENYKIHLYNALDVKPLPARPSRGYLSFAVSDDAFIPAGTMAAAGDTVFAVTDDLHASPVKITDIYAVSANGCQHCVGIENVYLFDCRGDNPVSWTIEHPYAFNTSGFVGLTADCSALAALNDSAKALWEISDTCLTLRVLDKEAFDGTAIKNIGLLPQGSNLTADAVYANDIQLPSEGFYPFGERFTAFDEVYFACDEAFEKRGAVISVNLSARMEKFPIEGYPQPQPAFKPVMKLKDLNIPEAFEIFISGIAWEYFNGTGWAALETTPHRDIFYSSYISEQLIEFICPDDFDVITVGAHEKRYIRARITQVENAYSMYGCYWSPFIEKLLFSYRYESPLKPSRVTSFQNMEENHAPASIVERKFKEPAMYLSIDRVVQNGSVLVELDECGAPANLRWEYHSEKGWSAFGVDDGTLGFSRTGLVSYSANLPWGQISVFGKLSYWIRIIHQGGDVRRAKLSRIWGNAVTAECTVGGTDGNVTSGEIVKLMQAIPNVDTVINPLPMENGSGDESYEDAVKRYMTERRVTICR